MSHPINPLEAPLTTTHFINFNQDCTSLLVGGKGGFRLYSLSDSVETLKLIHNYEAEDMHAVERLFNSSLVGVVPEKTPHVLKVCHFKKDCDIWTYSYPSPILAVKLNRSRLVVCLENVLHVYNIKDMEKLHMIRDTPPNPQGLCALSVNDEGCYLAYPGSSTIGEVLVFDATNLRSKCSIAAHNSPLAALAFNHNGSRLATASEKGTVIRVFSVVDGSRLLEFRRGVKRCVAISSLTFSVCGQFLACSSNTETVHVFKLDDVKDGKSVEDSGWMGYLSTYLPTQVTDVFTQGRAFATARLPVWGVRNILAITTIQHVMRLLVASSNGYLYVYNLNEVDGGDLTLAFQHRIDGLAEEPITTQQQQLDNGSPNLGSYAGILKGNPPDQMSGTESEKYREMVNATQVPPKGALKLNDDDEYPPLVPHVD